MVDQAPKKKRKVTSKAGEDVSKQPIEALEAYKELHASWPPDMPLMLSAVGISEVTHCIFVHVAHFFFHKLLPRSRTSLNVNPGAMWRWSVK